MTVCHYGRGSDPPNPCHRAALVTVRNHGFCPEHATKMISTEKNRRSRLSFRIGDEPALRAALGRATP